MLWREAVGRTNLQGSAPYEEVVDEADDSEDDKDVDPVAYSSAEAEESDGPEDE